MNTNNYEVHLLVNGKPVREYFHQGKFYVEARQNTHYSIKIKNHSHKKIMAIVSVDGIDVLKGGKAVNAESGYIINSYSSTEIKGYRIDDDNIATFKFDDGKKSYSTQVEQKFDPKKIKDVERGNIAPSKNNGVIGVRIWEEKDSQVIPEWQEKKTKLKNLFYNDYGSNLLGYSGTIVLSGCRGVGVFYLSGASSVSYSSGLNNTYLTNATTTTGCAINNNYSVSNTLTDINQFGELKPIQTEGRNRLIFQSETVYVPNFNLGTTWGDQQEDKIVKVLFEKAEGYIDLELFYLQRDELIKLGIDLDNAKKVFISGYPEAFGDNESYCKKPLNWKN